MTYNRLIVIVAESIQPSTPTTQTSEHNTPSTSQSSSSSTNQTSTRQVKDLHRIFAKCSTKVQKALQSSVFLGYDEKKSLVHVIEEYMVDDLNNTTLGTVNAVCKQIVDEYPGSFKVKIGNQDLKGAASSLGLKVYNRIHYNKKGEAESTLTQNENDDDEPCVGPKAQDKYGCVAYLPNLTPPETWESQEKKRLELIQKYESAPQINANILTSMSETYCLQRRCIHKDKDVSKFFDDWPYFKFPNAMIAHANELLGKDTMAVWKGSLNQLRKPINALAQENEIVASNKYRKKHKNAALPLELTCVRKKIKEAKGFSESAGNDDSYCNILFDFIVEHMGGKEDITYLYLIIDVINNFFLKLILLILKINNF